MQSLPVTAGQHPGTSQFEAVLLSLVVSSAVHGSSPNFMMYMPLRLQMYMPLHVQVLIDT